VREQGLGLDAIEIWFTDEARIGQKNGITPRWARRGTRPSAPQDQRYASTYIFGAVCPQEGKGAALVLPFCNTVAMNLHLAEISEMVSPGKHAVLLLDHISGRVAPLRRGRRAGQHHPATAAAEMPGAERHGERRSDQWELV
jgi:hypothetical protein